MLIWRRGVFRGVGIVISGLRKSAKIPPSAAPRTSVPARYANATKPWKKKR